MINIKFELDEKQKPLISIENIKLLTEAYNIKFSYDSITRKKLISFPDNLKKEHIDPILHLCWFFRGHGFYISDRMLKAGVNILCGQNRFNRVYDVLTSTVWDGRDRLEDLYSSVELLSSVVDDFDRIKKYYIKTFLKQILLTNCFNHRGNSRSDYAMSKNILVLTRRGDTDPCIDFLVNLLPVALKQYFESSYSQLEKVNATLVHLCDLANKYKSVQGLIHRNKWKHQKNISYCYTTTDRAFLDNQKNYDFLFVLPVSEIHNKSIDMLQVYAQLRNEIEHQIRTGIAIRDILRMPAEYEEDHRNCLRYAREDTYCYHLISDFIDLDVVNDDNSEPLTAYRIYKELIKRNNIKIEDTDDMADNIAKVLQQLGFEHNAEYKFRVKFK